MKPVLHTRKNTALRMLAAILLILPLISHSQTTPPLELKVDKNITYQTMAGFGASLAYYENWLTAHPNKAQIYDVIFKELSLDILRVRNAYGYDAGMITRVKEFNTAANNSLGKPIDILVTSWGPPASLKRNKDKSNGGTLRYTVENGKVNFDYAGFAKWWNESLDNYNANGVYPTYISIQNEPDFKATWESCLLRPSETVNSADTIAGYNKALDAVYDTIMKRTIKPKFLGPETIGIGYNAVENYVNALDLKKLYGIAHHLYHGAEENNPYLSTNFAKVGNFRKEVPHFQTEYSRAGWYSMIGMIYKSLKDEQVVAYLYWDLIWENGGLVSLDFPWDRNRWTNTSGFTRTKEFYVMKQYSAYIHPGWQRTSITEPNANIKTLAFFNPGRDSATVVAINISTSLSYDVKLALPGMKVLNSKIVRTSEEENEVLVEAAPDTLVTLPPRSITTMAMQVSDLTGIPGIRITSGEDLTLLKNYPNPFSHQTTLEFSVHRGGPLDLQVYDFQGRLVRTGTLGHFSQGIHRHTFNREDLSPGIYLYRLGIPGSSPATGKFTISGE